MPAIAKSFYNKHSDYTDSLPSPLPPSSLSALTQTFPFPLPSLFTFPLSPLFTFPPLPSLFTFPPLPSSPSPSPLLSLPLSPSSLLFPPTPPLSHHSWSVETEMILTALPNRSGLSSPLFPNSSSSQTLARDSERCCRRCSHI